MSSSINNTMVFLLLATVGVILAGLIVIPVIEAAEAANAISESRNKGQQGESSSVGKRKGQGGGIDI